MSIDPVEVVRRNVFPGRAWVLFADGTYVVFTKPVADVTTEALRILRECRRLRAASPSADSSVIKLEHAFGWVVTGRHGDVLTHLGRVAPRLVARGGTEISAHPRVFISSTIHDLRDLRSALEFWLDQQGCEVFLSQGNESSSSIDLTSFPPCATTIDSADYVLLLIGSRAGGWHDESARTSRTRNEYRYAHERFRASGKPRILTFVRREVWAVRSEPQSLREILRATGQDLCPDGERISDHPDIVAARVDAIIDFIEEVCRNEQTRVAGNPASWVPTRHGVHPFETFAELVEPLQRELRAFQSARAGLISGR